MQTNTQYTQDNPLNKDNALLEFKNSEDFKLFLVEFGLFHTDDTNTPTETYFVLVSCEEKEDSISVGKDLCYKHIGTLEHEFFSQINFIEEVESDYLDN